MDPIVHADRPREPTFTWSRRFARPSSTVRRRKRQEARPLRDSAEVRASTVDIVYLCSNKSTTSVTAAQIREISGAIGDSARSLQPRVKRGWNRLSDEDQAVVVARYKDGATSTALAADFGVAKSTILRILRDARTVVRRQSLTLHQVTEAARLYESGLSLSKVAKHLDVNQETMRVAIIAAGVTLRPPTGRQGDARPNT